MALWQMGGEIIPFDIQRHGNEALAERGLVAVASNRPTGEIVPGLQNEVFIDLSNVVLADEEALVRGDQDVRVAAGRLVQQIAYRQGLPPGHAGVHFGQRSPDACIHGGRGSS